MGKLYFRNHLIVFLNVHTLKIYNQNIFVDFADFHCGALPNVINATLEGNVTNTLGSVVTYDCIPPSTHQGLHSSFYSQSFIFIFYFFI